MKSETQSVRFQTNERELNYLSQIDNELFNNKTDLEKNFPKKDCKNNQKMGQKISKFPYHLKNHFDEEQFTKVNGLVASKSLFNYDDFENINKNSCSNDERFNTEIENSIKRNGTNSYLKYSISFNNSFQPFLSDNNQYDLLNATLANNATQNSASPTFTNETNNDILENKSAENANYFSSENNFFSKFSENFSKSIDVEEETNKNRQSTSSTLSSISSINSGFITRNFSFNDNLNSKVYFIFSFFLEN